MSRQTARSSGLMRLQTLIYALALLLNLFVAVSWTALAVVVGRQHDFTFRTWDVLLFSVPLASILALLALLWKLRY
jgi:hypothetical protein